MKYINIAYTTYTTNDIRPRIYSSHGDTSTGLGIILHDGIFAWNQLKSIHTSNVPIKEELFLLLNALHTIYGVYNQK